MLEIENLHVGEWITYYTPPAAPHPKSRGTTSRAREGGMELFEFNI